MPREAAIGGVYCGIEVPTPTPPDERGESWRETFLERKERGAMKRKGGADREADDFDLGFQGGALVTVRVHSLARAHNCAA